MGLDWGGGSQDPQDPPLATPLDCEAARCTVCGNVEVVNVDLRFTLIVLFGPFYFMAAVSTCLYMPGYPVCIVKLLLLI